MRYAAFKPELYLNTELRLLEQCHYELTHGLSETSSGVGHTEEVKEIEWKIEKLRVLLKNHLNEVAR